jgi:hypothetical protein
MKTLREKLVRVERFVQIIRQSDEKLIDEIEIAIQLEILQGIINPSDFDSLILDNYELSNQQILEINLHISNKIQVQLDSCVYVLIAGGIYDWKK